MALALQPRLLLLDEPTAGLDPLMEAVFQECIREAKERGTSVLLSSHILAQVEALADRISIVRAGQVIESGTLAELRHLTRTHVEVTTEQPVTGITDLDGVHGLVADGTSARFDVDGEHMQPVVATLANLGVRSLVSHPPTLEQLLLRHYGNGDAETAVEAEKAAEHAENSHADGDTGRHTRKQATSDHPDRAEAKEHR